MDLSVRHLFIVQTGRLFLKKMNQTEMGFRQKIVPRLV